MLTNALKYCFAFLHRIFPFLGNILYFRIVFCISGQCFCISAQFCVVCFIFVVKIIARALHICVRRNFEISDKQEHVLQACNISTDSFLVMGISWPV